MIAKANFNPLHPEAKVSIKRLRMFHKTVAEESCKVFPTLVLNDGAIAYRDLSYRSPSVTYDFLIRSWKLFNAIQKHEQKYHYAGARMVIATGFRVKGRRNGIEASSSSLRSVLKRLECGEISSDQAINEAHKITPYFDVIPRLQSNYAFTKAYLAESAGSAGGLAGSKCFVDNSIFDLKLYDWIELENPVHWENNRLNMRATFSSIKDIHTHKVQNGVAPAGIKNGLEIAQYLAGDDDVLRALRNAEKP